MKQVIIRNTNNLKLTKTPLMCSPQRYRFIWVKIAIHLNEVLFQLFYIPRGNNLVTRETICPFESDYILLLL